MAKCIKVETVMKTAGQVSIVLVVEDNEDDRFLLERAFSRAKINLQIEWAKDGAAAKRFLEDRARAGPLPNCVLLDLKLPGMDGFELLDYIRSRLEFSAVPVAILTTSNNPTDSARAYRQGATGYFIKPGALESLVQMTLALEQQWTGRAGTTCANLGSS